MRLGFSVIASELAAFSHVAVAANLQPPVNRTAGAEPQVFWERQPQGPCVVDALPHGSGVCLRVVCNIGEEY
ncbi:hypothetical protein CVT25_000838 [Psilocybe cyanescens]|uniref:Secreted protein n=1 Tax=Psilocybe cyanescens TaxID=93625 RepID=A0A409XSD9_PSICY|nr:hypothetical protein CVT25_000838 [Psilocybe cyanescens]